MSDEYTPTTEEMRWVYVRADRAALSREEYEAEFDRWLASELAKAWDEGFSRGFYRGQILIGDYDASEAGISNPYEEEKNDE